MLWSTVAESQPRPLPCWRWQWGPDARTATRARPPASSTAFCPSGAGAPETSQVIHTWKERAQVKGVQLEPRGSRSGCPEPLPESRFHKHPQCFQVDPGNRQLAEVNFQPGHEKPLWRRECALIKGCVTLVTVPSQTNSRIGPSVEQ